MTTSVMAFGIVFLVGGVSGYLFVQLKQVWKRLLLVVIAILIITPETTSSVIGIGAGLAY
jgi:TRAP-type uncharacterized transport system fused permease subunit